MAESAVKKRVFIKKSFGRVVIFITSCIMLLDPANFKSLIFQQVASSGAVDVASLVLPK